MPNISSLLSYRRNLCALLNWLILLFSIFCVSESWYSCADMQQKIAITISNRLTLFVCCLLTHGPLPESTSIIAPEMCSRNGSTTRSVWTSLAQCFYSGSIVSLMRGNVFLVIRGRAVYLIFIMKYSMAKIHWNVWIRYCNAIHHTADWHSRRLNITFISFFRISLVTYTTFGVQHFKVLSGFFHA